jgi:hypothetical protein
MNAKPNRSTDPIVSPYPRRALSADPDTLPARTVGLTPAGTYKRNCLIWAATAAALP